MNSKEKQLTEKECIALREFIEDKDRGLAGLFVGRQAELDHVKTCVKRLIRKQADSAPGADLTTVIQGAPGAGKSAFLEKVEETWPINEQGQAVAVSLDPEVLTRPVPDFLAAVASKVEKVPGLVQVLLHHVRLKSITVGGVVSLELDPAPPSSQPLVPVILLFDEIQTELLLHATAESRGHLTRNLRLLHTGRHGAPMFPIYGGLANSADLLRSAGLTRLASGSEWTLSGFSDDEIDELVQRFVQAYLASVELDPAHLDDWREALRRDSQGWPMHTRNFLIALSRDILAKGGQPAAVDLGMVRQQARQLRFEYYAHRMQGVLVDRYVLVSQVLDAMGQGIPRDRGQIVEWIEQAHEQCRPEHARWGALPAGTTPDQGFAALLHGGIIQKAGRGSFICPIPSLADYVAAKSPLPPSPLHNAVLEAHPAVISLIMEACRDDEERGRLLQATDRRGRTPLMLAVELGIGSVVEQLVAAEGQLPAKLRSLEMQDHTGRTARDHATASGDERLGALLGRLSPPESFNTKERMKTAEREFE